MSSFEPPRPPPLDVIQAFGRSIFRGRNSAASKLLKNYQVTPLHKTRGTRCWTFHVRDKLSAHEGIVVRALKVVEANKEESHPYFPEFWSLIGTLKHLEKRQCDLDDELKAMIPKIIAYDLKVDNPIRAPYIVMDYIPGTPADAVIKSGADPQIITRFYTALAKFVYQLHNIQEGFTYTGAFGTAKAPTKLEKNADIDGNLVFEADNERYFRTAELTYRDYFGMVTEFWTWPRPGTTNSPGSDNPQIARGACYLADAVFGDILIRGGSTDVGSVKQFALCHPNLSLDRILVDQEGNIKGILGWMYARVEPGFVGLGRLPPSISESPITTPRYPKDTCEPTPPIFSPDGRLIGSLEYAGILGGLLYPDKLDSDRAEAMNSIKLSALTWDMLKSEEGRVSLMKSMLEEYICESEDEARQILLEDTVLDEDNYEHSESITPRELKKLRSVAQKMMAAAKKTNTT